MADGNNPQQGIGVGQYIAFNGGTFNSYPWNGTYPGEGHPVLPLDNMKPGRQMPGAQQVGFVGARVTLPQATSGDYRLECRTALGALLGKVAAWYNAIWVDEANGPGSLNFSYPADEDIAASFVSPNEIWLYRGDDASPRRKFLIQGTEEVEGADRVISVRTEGLLAQWAIEQIEAYNLAGTPSTVEDILRDWMNLHQDAVSPIQMGVIDSSIGDAVFAASIPGERKFLKALREMHDVFGGFMTITPGRRLTWRSDIGTNLGHVITFKKNADEVKHDIEYRGLQNRLICKGVDFDDNPLEVTVQDASSQSTYGVRSGVFTVVTAVEDDTVLTTLANNELARRAYPREKWKVGAIDLSQLDKYDYSWEATFAEPGTVLRVVGAEFNIVTKVFRATRDLSNPVAVVFKVGDTSGGVGTDVSFKSRPNFIEAVAGVIRFEQEQRGIT